MNEALNIEQSDSIQWKKYNESENKEYYVSNIGTLKSIGKKSGSITYLSLNRKNNKGYRITGYRDENGKVRDRTIHRIVAEAFIGPIPEGMVVNHKNGNILDNRVENLEIVTPLENSQHAIEVLGHNPGPKPSEEDILILKKLSLIEEEILSKEQYFVAINKASMRLKATAPTITELNSVIYKSDRRKEMLEAYLKKKPLGATYITTTGELHNFYQEINGGNLT